MVHVGGSAPILHVIEHWVIQLVLNVVIGVICPIPPPKIVRITRAATRMTTAVTTIIMVSERAFMLSATCDYAATTFTRYPKYRIPTAFNALVCPHIWYVPCCWFGPIVWRRTSSHLPLCYANGLSLSKWRNLSYPSAKNSQNHQGCHKDNHSSNHDNYGL
jgi:hypothetical protein